MRSPRRPINSALKRALFFIGWLLSPFSLWNDAIVNMPISYLAANIAVILFKADFTISLLASYWLSNIAGLAMMALAGNSIFKDREKIAKEAVKLILTIAIYSEIAYILSIKGVLKPFVQ